MYKHLQKAWKHGDQFYCTGCGSRFEKDDENHFVSGVTAQKYMEEEHLSELRCFSCGAVLVQETTHGGFREGAGRRPKPKARETLVTCARFIAVYGGYTDLVDGLQPIERLRENYLHEIEEFKEALVHKTWLHWLHEASDVAYYAACIDAQAGSDIYPDALRESAQLMRFHGIHVTSEQIEKAALAKYEYRASGPNAKNEEHELSLIQESVGSIAN